MTGQTPGRRALLFVDNASSHGTPTNPPELQHAKLEFLPKNTTPLLQPLDPGMIACIKKHYKSLIAKRVVNLVDSGYTDNPYKVDVRKRRDVDTTYLDSRATRHHLQLLEKVSV